DRLRHDRRMVAEGRCRDAGANLHPVGLGAERPEPGERVGRMPAGVLPRLKMVADKDRVEADRLGQARELQQLARPELFGRRLVSELQHLLLPLKRTRTAARSPRAVFRRPGEACLWQGTGGRDPSLAWIPAFAGMTRTWCCVSSRGSGM